MNIKTLLTNEEIRLAISGYFATISPGHGVVQEGFQVEGAVIKAQDAKTKRVIFEGIEKLKARESAFHTFNERGVEDCILIRVKDWQEFKKWALGE